MKYIGNLQFVSVANDDIIKRIKQHEHPRHPNNKLNLDTTLITLTKLDIVVSKPCSFLINKADVLEVAADHTTSDNFRTTDMLCLTAGASINLTYEYGDYYTIPKTKATSTGGGGTSGEGLTPTQVANINKIPAIATGVNTVNSDLTAHKNNTIIHHTHTNKTVLDGITQAKVANWDSAAGEEYYPSDLAQIVVNPMGGFAEGDSLYGKSLAEILEVLLCMKENTEQPLLYSFAGMRDSFKDPTTFTYDDLLAITTTVPVEFPQTIYDHEGTTVYNKQVVCAIPKAEGQIVGVVDGAGISIEGAYPIIDLTLDVPGVGPVLYSVSANRQAQMYNANVVVKFNLV